MTGYAGAIQILNGNCFAGRDGYTPRFIIIHGTAGGSSAQNIGYYFQSTQGTNNPVSANYAVGQDGAIVQCNDERDGAWANGVLSTGHDSWWSDTVNPNNITISIELVKPDLQNATAPTAAQLASLVKLVNDICNRWGIPKQAANANGGITGHYSIDPVNRQDCPGNFNWSAFFTALNPPPAPTRPAWMQHASIPQGGTKAVAELNAAQKASFQKAWNTSAHTEGYTSGIALSWQDMNARGLRIGPPTTDEYDDVDWSNKPIRARYFGDVRCEWRDNKAYWYGPYGEILV